MNEIHKDQPDSFAAYAEPSGITRCPVCKMPMNGDPEMCLPKCAIRLRIEQKLTEAQAATVERCAHYVSEQHPEVHLGCDDEPVFSAKEIRLLLQGIANELRALSPDPRAKERWELRAKMDAAFTCGILAVSPEGGLAITKYFEELGRQLAALGKEPS